MSEKQHKKRKGNPRPKRRPAEDIPSADYVDKMELLGPRDGESYLSFRKRMAVVKEARRLWLGAWKKHRGQREQSAGALGVPRSNIVGELKRVGLTPVLLDAMIGLDQEAA